VELAIKNNGKTALAIADSDVAISGADVSYFIITQMPAASIPAGGSSTLRIKQSALPAIVWEKAEDQGHPSEKEWRT
jgi:hypothetical protein